jgi:hypothetical protein
MDSNGMILFDLLKPKKEVLLFNSDIFLELFHYGLKDKNKKLIGTSSINLDQINLSQ